MSYIGQEKHSHGIGDGRGKENKGQGHSGEDTINRKGLRGGKAKALQATGNPDSFGAGQNI